jgi:hypothetical protein
MIELTPEQRQAVAQGEPVRVVDETTREVYVLMRAEVFERTAGAPQPQPTEEVSSPVSPAMLRAQRAFWRDLPELLKNRRNHLKWVAYHGDERVGLGKTRTELYNHCLGRGLRPGEFYIGRVRERPTPPWEPTELEESLYEFTDDPSFPPPAS